MTFYEMQHLRLKEDRSVQFTVSKIRDNILVLCKWANEFDDVNYTMVECSFDEAKKLMVEGW